MEYSKLAIRIVMDEDKVIREGKYSLEKIYQAIDKLAENAKMIKVDKTLYEAKGDKHDLECMGIFIYHGLIQQSWFLELVKEWEWIEKDTHKADLIDYLKQDGYKFETRQS